MADNLACQHCGAHTPIENTPDPGDMLFCVWCGGIAVWDEAGGWRDMTKEEHLERLDDAGYLEAADHLMWVRQFIERDRANLTRIITTHLTGCTLPWHKPDKLAADLANALMREGFHAAHPVPEDTDESN